MKQLDDSRLEEVREFYARPAAKPYLSETINAFVRDTLWLLEELQFRRLQERVVFKPDERPWILFGTEESVLAHVEANKLERWQHIEKQEQLNEIVPTQVRAHQCGGTDVGLWEAWEEIEKMYKPGASA
jgi:hypothetical protein